MLVDAGTTSTYFSIDNYSEVAGCSGKCLDACYRGINCSCEGEEKVEAGWYWEVNGLFGSLAATGKMPLSFHTCRQVLGKV